jgi:DNA-3-methyladenine glycosylase II
MHRAEIMDALKHLSTHDALLASLIEKYPAPTLTPHGNYYQELVESIISQQLSVKAAATITARFIESFGHFPAPEEIVNREIDQLRSCGLSTQKANYIRDLAMKVIDGSVQFDHMGGLSNQEIISELTAVKGIGEWTVHMFLIFCMGRLDVLAYGDLGVRTAIMRTYGLTQLPSPQDITQLAEKNHWHPYESVACWYLWRSLENMPSTP